jgi:hypothetical protein
MKQYLNNATAVVKDYFYYLYRALIGKATVDSLELRKSISDVYVNYITAIEALDRIKSETKKKAVVKKTVKAPAKKTSGK